MEEQIRDDYFEWMCGLIYGSIDRSKVSYDKLFRTLDQIDFKVVIPMDDNRAADGIDLRYRFAYENNLPDSLIASYLDIRPCSVFEMMVALAHVCEETIMTNSTYGDRTSKWFFDMINNLGLGDMTDSHFDKTRSMEIIFRFLDRDYDRDGRGGLFYVPNCERDMRSIEIWYQLNWYLNTIL